MEKKYLVGYFFGREAVMWDDVKDFTETFDEETGLTTINFKENGVEYTYVGNDRNGYVEQNNKAPKITGYKLIGRRTALRHDYLNDRNRKSADEVRAFFGRDEDDEEYDDEDEYEEDEDEDDYDEDDDVLFGRYRNRGHVYHPSEGCSPYAVHFGGCGRGGHVGCGGSSGC